MHHNKLAVAACGADGHSRIKRRLVSALRVTAVGIVVEVVVDALGTHGGGAVGHKHVADGVGA